MTPHLLLEEHGWNIYDLESLNCENNVKEGPCKDETLQFSLLIPLICIYYIVVIFVGENILLKMYFTHGIWIQLLIKCVTWTGFSQEMSFGKVKKPCSSINKIPVDKSERYVPFSVLTDYNWITMNERNVGGGNWKGGDCFHFRDIFCTSLWLMILSFISVFIITNP